MAEKKTDKTDKAEKDDEKGVVPPIPKPGEVAYIVFVGTLVNGVIMPGFENAEIYPGEPIKVRGEDGLNYDHAAKLVNNSTDGRRFVWCDAKGTPLEEEPKPTEEEDSIAIATGAYNLPGAPTQEYPTFHRENRDYTGPEEVPGPQLPPEQVTLTDAEIAAMQPAPMLSINRTNTVRREAVSDGGEIPITQDDGATAATENAAADNGAPEATKRTADNPGDSDASGSGAGSDAAGNGGTKPNAT